VTVTAEPLPTRVASIASGTGEVDAVYHIAFDALAGSVAARANREQAEGWREVKGQRRQPSYEMLISTLASWRLGYRRGTAPAVARSGQNQP
jgi:NgoMIV restriction enzyme